jgi:DNA helicase-2/ATP-dependent DNA helicase PcrA
MPQVINVTDEDIHYAEKILLPAGKEFDLERKTFIRNLKTIDLQAVPGSGKTTALLAKLLIIERKLPFQDGSGILVLSHTNAAIDEIKHKIQKHCPKLFSYPNFIGTIQSFVDEFLAVPFYNFIFKKKIKLGRIRKISGRAVIPIIIII